MKINKCINVLAALALGAFVAGQARASNTLQRTLSIEVQPTPVCSICGGSGGCAPVNMRNGCNGYGNTCIRSLTNNTASVTVWQHYCGDGGQWEAGGISWGGAAYTGWSQSPDSSYNPLGGAVAVNGSGVLSGTGSIWDGCGGSGGTGTTGSGGGLTNFSAVGGTGYYLYTAKCSNGLTSPSVFINKLHCFPAGTPILLCDGTEKAIETIAQGDCVESYNPATGAFVKSKVDSTIQAETNSYFEITTSAGTLKVTPMHEIYVNGQWGESQNIKVGDTLVDSSGQPVTVTSVDTVQATIPVYDLITDDPHDFFADNILVHNMNRLGEKNHGFAKGTMIALADGRLVPVEKIKVGDKLVSYDPVKKWWKINVVRKAASQMVASYKVINGKLKMGVAQPIFMAKLPKHHRAK